MSIRDLFRVDEIIIGHGGDSSVGMPCEFSTINLSDETAEILNEQGLLEQFKKELFDLFKSYDCEVCEVTDDVTETSSALYELIADMTDEEKERRIQVLEKEKAETYPFTKVHKMELAILKNEED